MFSSIRRHFGAAGLAVAVAALVLAMVGGAYAAKKYVITSTSQIKPSVLKSLKGKRGPQGPQGPAGTNGTNGKDGTNGTNGTNGKDGTNGTSATATSFTGAQGGCTEGGVKVDSASPTTFVCNGAAGADGADAEFPFELPEGETIVGTWGFGGLATGLQTAPISFSLVLPAPLTSTPGDEHVHFVLPNGKEINLLEEEVDSTDCLGTAAAPAAAPGHLCVYQGTMEGAVLSNGQIQKASGPTPGATDTMGAVLRPFITAAANNGRGTWAVTAE